MNNLIFKTNKEVVEMCLVKMEENRHRFKFNLFKYQKRFDYYGAVAGRILQDTQEYLNKEMGVRNAEQG